MTIPCHLAFAIESHHQLGLIKLSDKAVCLSSAVIKAMYVTFFVYSLLNSYKDSSYPDGFQAPACSLKRWSLNLGP